MLAAGIVLGFLMGSAGVFRGVTAGSRNSAAASVAPIKPAPAVALAAPGRIEGLTEMVNVGAAIDGVLESVLAREGNRVRAGQVIATITRRDLEAELQSARSAAESSRQARLRMLRGSRDEERWQAAAETARAQAQVENARSQHERMAALVQKETVSRQTYDKARFDLDIAEAALRAASAHETLVNARPLPEELARVDAEIRASEEHARSIQASLEKCVIRAPISGTVLRTYLKPGEMVSTTFPQPVAGIMDTSRRRVRAEIDERDLGRIHEGQHAVIMADAFPGKAIRGHVANFGSIMGRKKVQTGDPAEKSDRDVLEVMVDIDGSESRLVVGLRVTVQFLD
jgi:ABC exporter DevB family membrane fusion protein